jgi:hypothetical protein
VLNNKTKEKEMKKLLLLGAAFALGCLSTLAEPVTILSTDFGSHDVGAATESSLDLVTTGGTWALGVGGNPTDLVVDVSESNSVSGLMIYESTVSANTQHQLAELTLGTAAGFSGSDEVTWAFDTMHQTAASNTRKNNIYQFEDSAGLVVAAFRWRSNTGSFQYSNGDNTWTSIGNVSPYSETVWDPDSASLHAFSATFSADGVDVSLGGVSTNIASLAGSAANIGSFVHSIHNSGSGTRGVGAHFSDMTVTTIPEPATLGMVIAFGGGILFIRRKLMM